MNNFKNQKTYLGRTAGGYLSDAIIKKNGCGEPVIWLPSLKCEALQNESLDLHLWLSKDSDDEDLILTTSNTAARKLESLRKKQESMY